MRNVRSLLIASWGILGIIVLFGAAIVRLTPLALEPWLAGETAPWVVGIYLVSIVGMGYTEGFQAFQNGFCPRVVSRALELGRVHRPIQVFLAAPYCMSLLWAPRRRLIISWCVLLGVWTLVVVMRHVPQPWRGAVDAGVVVGLSWGVLAMVVQFARAVRVSTSLS